MSTTWAHYPYPRVSVPSAPGLSTRSLAAYSQYNVRWFFDVVRDSNPLATRPPRPIYEARQRLINSSPCATEVRG